MKFIIGSKHYQNHFATFEEQISIGDSLYLIHAFVEQLILNAMNHVNVLTFENQFKCILFASKFGKFLQSL